MVLMGLQIRMFELLQWKIVFVHCHPVQHLPRNGRASPCEIASVLPALLLPSLWFANQELNAPPSKSTHVQDVHVHHVHHFRSTEKQTISCCRGGNRRVLRLSLNYRLKSWSMLSLLGLRRGPVPYHKEGVEETDSLGLWQGDWTVSQTTRIWIWWQPTNLKSVGNSTAKWTATCDAIPVTPLRGLVPFFWSIGCSYENSRSLRSSVLILSKLVPGKRPESMQSKGYNALPVHQWISQIVWDHLNLLIWASWQHKKVWKMFEWHLKTSEDPFLLADSVFHSQQCVLTCLKRLIPELQETSFWPGYGQERPCCTNSSGLGWLVERSGTSSSTNDVVRLVRVPCLPHTLAGGVVSVCSIFILAMFYFPSSFRKGLMLNVIKQHQIYVHIQTEYTGKTTWKLHRSWAEHNFSASGSASDLPNGIKGTRGEVPSETRTSFRKVAKDGSPPDQPQHAEIPWVPPAIQQGAEDMPRCHILCSLPQTNAQVGPADIDELARPPNETK